MTAFFSACSEDSDPERVVYPLDKELYAMFPNDPALGDSVEAHLSTGVMMIVHPGGLYTLSFGVDSAYEAPKMQLFRFYTKRLLKIAGENNVRVKMIGDRYRFAQDIIDGINTLEEKTRDNTGLTFVIAVNYGSRDEIRRAVQKMLTDCRDGKLSPEEVDEAKITSYLDTAGIPDPDLMIRTSGELRLSNYLLWQLAYAELYVTDTLWPDFNREELIRAIEAYNKRERRFGGVKQG